MSEMAQYKGETVKIGTCEMMYYLRYEDRSLVTAMPNSVDPMKIKGLFYRLPFPEEDGFGPGSYEDFQPFMDYVNGCYHINGLCRLDNSHPALAEGPIDPGLVQTTVEQLGILVNLACYHGIKLNDNSGDAKFFWNGKRNPLALSYLKDSGTELRVVVSCIGCGHMWSYSFEDIEAAILDPIMKERIRKLCSDYMAQLKESEVTSIAD